MERGLPVEEHDVAVPHMSFYHITYFQVARDGVTVPVVQRLLVAAAHRTDHHSIPIS
jgi:hypothetical protein